MRIRFGHIPKCGGMKIKNILAPIKGFMGYRHGPKVCEVKADYRFVSIRHPLSWYVSLWSYKTQGRKYKNNPSDFETLLYDHLVETDKIHRWWQPSRYWHEPLLLNKDKGYGLLSLMFLRQAFINWEDILEGTELPDKFDIDRVVRLEHLECDLGLVFNDIGIKKKNRFNFKKKINSSIHGPNDYYYTEKTADLVLDREKLIIDLFYS